MARLRDRTARLWWASTAVAVATQSAGGAATAAVDHRTPEAIALQSGLERACLPLLMGRSIAEVAKSAGLRRDDSGWFLPLPGAERLAIRPPGGSNPTVCTMTVAYPIGSAKPLVDLLSLWSRDHGLSAVSQGRPSKGPFEQRVTWSWQGVSGRSATAIVIDTEKTLAGQPVRGNLDQATVLVSRTTSG